MSEQEQAAQMRHEIDRVVQAAHDSVTDDMVARLSESASQTMELLDRFNRSGAANAIPAIAQLINNGDLERLVGYARVLAAAEDAVTDDMVGRFAETIGEAVSIADRLSRSGVVRLVEVLEELNASGALDRLANRLPQLVESLELFGDAMHCLQAASRASRDQPASGTGIFEMLRLLRDPENMKFIHFALDVGKRMQQSCISRAP